ncbi:VWA domain-containing protein [Sulfobacillus thermosulfidooxidans]|uniref:VWA domain-containing protein n=1 Tax=Sulfobacillus thermosulfidooxidans TaxID=28034 RepID=UPI00031204E8|nr:VWA domain-containing protein [Sulfobacillus thermosulfidooxidans]
MDGVRVDQFSRRLEMQVIEFSHFLRQHGFHPAVSETKAALQLFSASPIEHAQDLLRMWRPVFAKTAEQWEIFPNLFQRFFYPERPRLTVPERIQESADDVLSTPGQTRVRGESKNPSPALFAYSPRWGSPCILSPGQDVPYHEMKHWTHHIARYWATKTGPWRGKSSRGRKLNWRATVQTAFRHGGDPVKWLWHPRRQEHARIVVLLDVSGSMQAYVPFYLGLIWQLMREGSRVECFLSSNQIKRVTPFLRRSGPGGPPVADAHQLGGGTRLGWAFSSLLHDYSRLFTRRTTFLIASDGFDTGDLWLLAQSFPVLVRLTQRVVWFNPLLLLPEYTPQSAALKIVLPYVAEHVGVADSSSWIHYVRTCLQ